ncbi:LytS/YhcK type 5TM receptor domain-containing protein [Ferviditalea candida]|uniref:LytS/YhcK type 5TM receptor domain-containing protein n=1 Tax=Ferviditalea candida TaxID=3108399 RepID=UPI00352C90FE
MFNLLIFLLERVGVIVTVAFVMTRFPYFRRMINRLDITRTQRLSVMIMFGLFGIIGTYTGFTVSTESPEFSTVSGVLAESEAIANSRVIGIIIAGLLGGVRLGMGAGLIAGFHRYLLGGFTALSCALSAVISGLIAGLVHRRIKDDDRRMRVSTAIFTAMLGETVQMIIILLLSRPFDQAFLLVQAIGVPMIVANGIGSGLFILIIRTVMDEEEKTGALASKKSLRLAELTIQHLRKGLSFESAQATCEILYREVNARAVAITDQQNILAHVGAAGDHHHSGVPIQTEATRRVLKTGALFIAGEEEILCREAGCPLKAVIIAPLKRRDETIGTLKFYFRSKKEISHVMIELMRGLSSLLSQQLEIAEAERLHSLAKEMEIKALQSQMSPHFLFNALNTIGSLIRIDPGKARKLVNSLGRFIRQNINGSESAWTTLGAELEQVKSYLEIEEARFVDKLKVCYEIDEQAFGYPIPPLTLQPIVENAIRHGLRGMDKNCRIRISAILEGDQVHVTIEDNGSGIAEERSKLLGKKLLPSEQGLGMALYNVNRRLIMQAGTQSALQITSAVNKGTAVGFVLTRSKREAENG